MIFPPGSPRVLVIALLLLVGASCASTTTATNDDPARDPETTAPGSASASVAELRLVTPTEASAIQMAPPEGLVVLDVRTAEEFAEGHIEGAIMIDFYGDDFQDQLAQLDPGVPYLLYCRSGNRSGQTRSLMEQLEFRDVADIDGGILAWSEAGLPVVS